MACSLTGVQKGLLFQGIFLLERFSALCNGIGIYLLLQGLDIIIHVSICSASPSDRCQGEL